MFKLNIKSHILIGRIIWAVLIACLSFLIVFLASKCFLKAVIYPTPYRETVLKYSTENGLSPSLIYAIIKCESNFDTNAISEKGAKGLMQLTDKTAEYIAKLCNIEHYDLFDEKTNIQFGCFYLSYLKDKFSSMDNAIIAYNAGEGNLIKWLYNPKYTNDGKTLKTIPFPETNIYYKKVKKTFEKYKKLYVHILDK